MRKINLIIFFLIFILNIFPVSLWNDKAANIYNSKIYYNVGDSIQIKITEDFTYEYRASYKTLKSFKLDSSGGELSGIISFIPKGQAEDNKTGNEKDSAKIKSIIQARVVRVENNFITIQGSKTITLNNKTSSVTITGDASLTDIKNNSILSGNLVNMNLSITTLIDNANVIIRNQDIETNPDATTDKNKLSDAKKREILLEYFNKILNVIF